MVAVVVSVDEVVVPASTEQPVVTAEAAEELRPEPPTSTSSPGVPTIPITALAHDHVGTVVSATLPSRRGPPRSRTVTPPCRIQRFTSSGRSTSPASGPWRRSKPAST